MRSIPTLALAFCVVLVWAESLLAETRHALVIGNDRYQAVTRLERAVSDARAMAETLSDLGFTVTTAENAARRDINRALQRFASAVQPGDVALVFYAGHGIEVEGRNYLLPTDIPDVRPGEEEFVTAEAIALSDVLAMLQDRQARLNMVILDACRDNPFPTANGRSVGTTRGLARINAPTGTFVMYSADAGEAALDRLEGHDPSPNSVFTRTLIPLLKSPGKDLVAIARETRREVRRLAAAQHHRQTPAYYDAVIGDFYFTPKQAVLAAPPRAEMAEAYAAAAAINTVRAWDLFLERFGADGGYYVDLAREALAQLQPAAAPAPQPEPEQQTDDGTGFAATRRAGLQCEWRDDIVEMADLILSKRSNLTGFRPGRYGTLAATLKLNYEQADYAAGRRILTALAGLSGRARPRQIEEALMVWETTFNGTSAGLATLDADPVTAVERIRYHGLRAMLLDKGGQGFVDMAAAGLLDAPGPTFSALYYRGLRAPAYLSDQSDAFRTRLADAALKQGLPILAAALLADNRDRAAFQSLHEAQDWDVGFVESLQPAQLEQSLIGLRSGAAPHDPDYAYRPQIKAAYFGPQQDFLNITLNMSGRAEETKQAAEAYLAAIDRGEIDPLRDPDGAAVEMLRQLTMAYPGVDEVLTGFDWPIHRYFVGRARASLDIMVMADALGPAVRHQAPIPSEPPDLLSDRALWPNWTRIAEDIRMGRTPAIQDPSDVTAAIELFYAAGDIAGARSVIDGQSDDEAVRMLRDLMVRLDRRCAAVTFIPGAALSLAGDPLIDFSLLRPGD